MCLQDKQLHLAGKVQNFGFKLLHGSLCIERKIGIKRSIGFSEIAVAKQATKGESYALFICLDDVKIEFKPAAVNRKALTTKPKFG